MAHCTCSKNRNEAKTVTFQQIYSTIFKKEFDSLKTVFINIENVNIMFVVIFETLIRVLKFSQNNFLKKSHFMSLFWDRNTFGILFK